MLINDQSSTAIPTSGVPMFPLDAETRITIRRALCDQRDVITSEIVAAVRKGNLGHAQHALERLDDVERVLAAVRAFALAD